MRHTSFRDRIIGLVLAMPLLTACGTSQSTPVPTLIPSTPTRTLIPFAPTASGSTVTRPAQVSKDIAYTSALRLDVYAPADSGPWPVIVVLHGGDDSKQFVSALSAAVAEQGAVVFTPDWRANEPDWRASESPLNEVTGGWEDVACAIRFARTMATDYGGDPSWLTVVGHSGGAAAGATMALAGDDFEGDCVVKEVSALSDAFVGINGAYDFLELIPYGQQKQAPELWGTLSPYTYLDRHPIRTGLRIYIVNGERDGLKTMAVEFHEALMRAGYDPSLMLVANGDHNNIVERPFEEVVHTIMHAARHPPKD